MGEMKKMAAVVAAMGVLASASAQATLYDRGGGLIYDDVLKITWLEDANYAKTSGYDGDGRMNWGAAKAWAAGLSYFDSLRNVTWSDWRLPTVNPVGAAFNYDWSNNGTTDYGYGNTSPNSEMAYMYYVNLGNLGYCTPDNGSPTSCNVQSGWGLASTGPFDNLQFDYWSGTAIAPRPASAAWNFFTDVGYQASTLQLIELFAWAVRPGDVAAAEAVPAPGSLVLLGAGLLAMAVQRRRGCFGAS
jgi:hypothetical protein